MTRRSERDGIADVNQCVGEQEMKKKKYRSWRSIVRLLVGRGSVSITEAEEKLLQKQKN